MRNPPFKNTYRDITREKMPSFVAPMLATLTEEYFDNPEWIFEQKLDGVRAVAIINRDTAEIFSRNRKNLDSHYPEIIDALKKVGKKMILDGEIVAFEDGTTSFQKLQERIGLTNPQDIKKAHIPVFYYIFDILFLNDLDLRKLSLEERKEILKMVNKFKDPLRMLDYKYGEGLVLFEHACKEKWEGLIAKEKNSPYESKRSKKWLKFKCTNQQEFIIIGYTEPRGKRVGFGALLLGYYDREGKIRYAGKVGTGYDEKFLRNFYSKLENIRLPEDDSLFSEKGIYPVKPKFVGEVRFAEWTKDGSLRHPVFLGLREDKRPAEVTKEEI